MIFYIPRLQTGKIQFMLSIEEPSEVLHGKETEKQSDVQSLNVDPYMLFSNDIII